MAARVLIHVGAPKTGTSYLESIIWGQRARLEADGIWMPGRGRAAHDALMGEVRGGVWRHANPAWTWQKVADEARRRDDVVLVSKEMLSGATAEEATIATGPLRDEEVHIIVTARQLAASLPSSWQQAVKARMRVPFGQWLAAVRRNPGHGFWRHQDPISIAQRWAPGFPPERVHVITMPPDSSDPTALWRRFASVIGVDPDSYEAPEKPRNESLGAVEIELLRRVNVGLGDALPMRDPYLDNVRAHLTRPVLLRRPDKVKFGVGAEYADWLVERADQTIRELGDYGCQIIGDLEDLRPRHELGLPSPDEVSEADIAALAVEALAKVLINAAQ